MMWKPKLLFTSSDVVPGAIENTAWSKAGTIRPGGKQPRSPPLWAEPASSEPFRATAAKSAPPLTSASSFSAIACASASACPSLASGEALTLIRMWLAQTSDSCLNSSGCSR